MTRSLTLSLLVLMAGACGPATQQSHGKGGTPPPRRAEPHGAKGPIDIEKAALPFAVLRANGSEVTQEAFLADVVAADAVCVGEQHSNPHDHWAQLQVLTWLAEHGNGRPMALGMEMLPYPVQAVLDDYAAGKIEEKEMLARVGWSERWGVDYSMYGPMVRLARERRMAILALNAPRELTRKVSRQGLAALSPDEKKTLPELDLEVESHRAFFRAAMEEHSHHTEEKGLENLYTAQVIWDESMAHHAHAWLAGGEGRQIMVIAGSGHCRKDAVPARIKRRGAGKVVSIKPVLETGDGEVADLLVHPESDYLFVMRAEPAE